MEVYQSCEALRERFRKLRRDEVSVRVAGLPPPHMRFCAIVQGRSGDLRRALTGVCRTRTGPMRALRPVYMVTVQVGVRSQARPARRSGAPRPGRPRGSDWGKAGAGTVAGARTERPEDDEGSVGEHGAEAGHVTAAVPGDVVGARAGQRVVVDGDDGHWMGSRSAVRPEGSRRPCGTEVVLVVGGEGQGAHGRDLGLRRRAGRREVRGRVGHESGVSVSR